jgi:hypothetical protein
MRQPGYYWVKYTGEWIICEWLEPDWYFINATGTTDDTAFDEIDERRIDRSDPGLTKEQRFEEYKRAFNIGLKP